MICFIKYHIKFVLIISFIILLGCKLQDPLKTHGIIYLENRSKKVELKKSNKNDIIKIMGRPQIENIEEGETWIYIERILTKGKYHKLGQHVLKQSNVLVLDFDKYGVLTKKEFFTKDDMNEVKFSKDETENVLTQKSFVQKFLQSIKSKMYSNKK